VHAHSASHTLVCAYAESADEGYVASDAELYKWICGICERLRGGEHIYIHCYSGTGRTGLVCSCILVVLYDLDAERAIKLNQNWLMTRDNLTGKHTVASPSTEKQRLQVARVAMLHEEAHSNEKKKKEEQKKDDEKKRLAEQQSAEQAKKRRIQQQSDKVNAILQRLKK
jgi:hypothetical protein